MLDAPSSETRTPDSAPHHATDWQLRLLLVVASAALALAAFGGWRSIQRLESAHAESLSAYDRQAQLGRVLDLLMDEESGSRGFILTGDSAFLKPYGAAESRIDAEWQRFLALQAGHAEDSARAHALGRLIIARRSHTDSTLNLAEESRARARDAVATGRGLALMDSIRLLSAEVGRRDRATLDSARLAVEERRRMTTVSLWGETALALVLLGIAAAMAQRRRAALGASLREVARLNEGLESTVAAVRAELTKSEAQLRGSLDRMLEGCQLLDKDLRFLYVNPTAARYSRSTVDAMVGRTLVELHPQAADSEIARLIRRVLDERVPVQQDVEFDFGDGSSGWFRVNIDPVPDGAFLLSVEITDHVRAERALARSEARHRALLRSLPECVALLDARGAVLDRHAPAAAEVPGFSEDLIGRPWVAAFPDALHPKLEDLLQRSHVDGNPLTTELYLDRDGARRYFEFTCVWEATEGGRYTVVGRDVSARRGLESQLRQSQKMEAVGQLTGGIAHDFNNILTVIGTNAELLSLQLGDDTTAMADLRQILDAKQRGAQMIAQLLSFSRRGRLQRELLAPGAVIRKFSGMLERLIPAYIRFEVGTLDERGIARLDAGALEQMLANLCTNARDAMPNGGRLRIECHTTQLDAGYHASHPWVVPGPYVCVAVSDTGQGMDEATRQRVFEPFFTTKAEGRGTGLGLAMVYGLMKEHEGMVHVYSEVGKGTVVRLYFPVVTDVAGAPSADRRSDPRRVVGGGETILFVEDEPAIRMAGRRALESKGYVVLDASDGERALELIRSQGAEGIDLIISDLVMPNLGGRQLVEALRADGYRTPIIFTSGYSAESLYRDELLPEGVAFLHKPWSLASLFTAVRSILDGQEFRDG